MEQKHESFVLERTSPKRLRYKDIDPASLVIYRQEGENQRVFAKSDYEFCNGMIRRTDNSAIPDFSKSPFYDISSFDHEKFAVWGNEPYMLFADYNYKADAQETTEYEARQLSLKNGMLGYLLPFFEEMRGKSLRFTIFGDSISTGCEASCPQFTFFNRIVEFLKKTYAMNVSVRNVSVCGESTFEGVRRYKKDVLGDDPQLVTVGFGMNDQNIINEKLTVEPGDYYKNILEITRAIQQAGAKVILIAPCIPHPNWIHTSGLMSEYVEKLYLVAKNTGAAIADVYHLWKSELGYKKCDDLLRNGINHPTDYGHYLYYLMLKNIIAGE